jgi:transcriptional regulator with XRE-family HTH domain
MNDQQLKEYSEWLKNFGFVVSRYRRKLGLSQREASAHCDMHLKFYRDIEYGRRPITTRTMIKLCTGLKMPTPFGEAIRLICD